MRPPPLPILRRQDQVHRAPEGGDKRSARAETIQLQKLRAKAPSVRLRERSWGSTIAAWMRPSANRARAQYVRERQSDEPSTAAIPSMRRPSAPPSAPSTPGATAKLASKTPAPARRHPRRRPGLGVWRVSAATCSSESTESGGACGMTARSRVVTAASAAAVAQKAWAGQANPAVRRASSIAVAPRLRTRRRRHG